MSQKHKSEYLYPIDFVRFFAASIVAMFHITFSVWANTKSGGSAYAFDGYSFPVIGPIFRSGWVGVEVFFIISGLVIANSSYNATPWKFFRSRFLRLYPSVWICATITLIFVLYAGGSEDYSTTERYVRSMTLFPLYPWIDPAYWTLPVEIFFYFVIFVMLVYGKAQRLNVVAYVMLMITFIFQALLLQYHVGILGWFPDLPLQVTRIFMMDFGAFFALGILIWLRMNQKQDRLWLPGVILAVLACIAEIFNHAIKAGANLGITDWGYMMSDFATAVTIWVVCCIVIAASQGMNRLSLFQNANVRTYGRTVGLMTFPLYLLHFVVGVSLIRIFQVNFGIGPYLALALALALVLFLAYAVCVWLEPPLRKVTDRVLSGIHRSIWRDTRDGIS